MKVAILSPEIFPVPPDGYGGVERQAYYQAKALTKLGYKVTVFSPRGAKAEGWTVFETGDPDPKRNPEKQRYRELIKPQLKDFDFIIDNSWTKQSMLDFDNVLGISHGHRSYQTFPPHGILASVSAWEAMSMSEYLNLPNANIDAWKPVPFIYNAVDSPFRDSGKHEDYLLYMARFSPYKGALHFLYLCKRNRMKGILIGGESFVESKEYVEKVKELAKSFNLDYRGEVDEKERNDLLEHANMLVSPLTDPYIEVFGMNLVEAMGVGTIPYATQKGATEEVIGDGGWTIPTVFEMLRNPLPPVDDGLRKKAVERAKIFSIDNLGKVLDTLIKQYVEADKKAKKAKGPVDDIRNSMHDTNIRISTVSADKIQNNK